MVVPDLRFYVERYISSRDPRAAIDFCLETGMGSNEWGMFLSRLRGDRHHIMYDANALSSMLADAGFASVREASYGDSHFDFSAVEDPGRWTKPGTIGFECIV